MKHFLIVGLLLATRCVAATYYVSPTGLDTNSGTSPGAPWLTLAHVNAQTFAPGDTIYLQRGGTWNEPLIVPSSGTSGNPISFDAYGTGPAPVLTAAAPSLTWTYKSGNIWAAQLPAAPASATVLNMQFGSLWGQYKAPSTTCLTAGVIVSPQDFCSYAGYVYVYDSSSTNGPAAFYGTTVTPILTVASGYQLISVSSKKWLTFQHIKLQNFDSIGVLVWAASDNLVFANMEADGMVPNSTMPLGFYINATSPTSIQLYNVDAHLNYDGFKIAGTAASASAITLVNCSAFGNRDAAIVDNVPGGSAVVTYSHFFGNGISTLWPQDVQGVAGPNVSSPTNVGTLVNISQNFAGGMVPNYIDPQIASVGRYAAWDTFTVDDVGLALPMTGNDEIYYPDTEAYINRNVLPAFNLYGLKFNAAVTTGYSAAQGYSNAVDTASVQNWFNQGHGINSHSWSHQYFTPAANLNAFTLLYNGTGTASISGNVLTTSVTGGTGSNLSLDLTVPPYDEVKSLVTYLNTKPGYTAIKSTVRDVPHTIGLADVSAQPISGSALQFVFDTQRMETDEMTTSRAWPNANIPGLNVTYYVTPDGQENNATQGYALTAGYTGERGELAMHGFLGGAWGTDEVASKGVGLMNIVSFGMVGWNTNTAAQMDVGIDSLMFRQKLWGYPIGLYIHMPDFTGTQIFQTLAGLTNHGSTVKLNTELRDWMLASWTVIPNTTPSGAFFQLPQSGAAFSAARTVLSPDIGAGQNLGAPWNYDINGVQRTGAWDIGAYQMANAVIGGGTGSGYAIVGNGNYIAQSQAPQLPLLWVNNNECNTNYTYELTFPGTWVGSAAPGWPTTLPYANTAAGVQQAILDAESYRTLALGHPGTRLHIPAGFVYSDVMGPYIPQTNTVAATQCNIVDSTHDASLPNGRTVCAHGIQDNLATSTDPGIDNADCTGANMYYQLGTTITTVPAGAFTFANGTVTNTSAFNDVQHMWTAECTASNCAALRFCAPVGGGSSSSAVPSCTSATLAPDHWLFMDIEFRPKATFVSTGSSVTEVQMNGSGSETSLAMFPHNIHFRKDWAHSDWATLATGLNGVSNAFFLNCSYCSIVDSQTSQNIRPSNEGHDILLDAEGPYKIDHNWLEGESSGIFAGGSASYPYLGLVPLQDGEIRRNRITFPYAWLGLNLSGNSHWSTYNFDKKNIEEIKAGKRVLFDGNIWENTDGSGGQQGPIADFNVRNDSSGFGSNYQIGIWDLTVSNTIMRNTCISFEMDRSSYTSGGGASYGVYRSLFRNDLLYNVSGTNPGCGGSNRGIALENSTGLEWQGTVSGNGTTATFVANCSVNQGGCPGQIASLSVATAGTGCTGNGNLVIGAPNLAGGRQATGTYTCAGGALTGVTLGGLGNFVSFGPGSGYTSAPSVTPATGTGTVTVTMTSGATAPTTGFQALSLATGDPVPVTMCPDTPAFNNVSTTVISSRAVPSQVGPMASSGSAAWNGNPSAANLTVSYPSTVNGSDNSGFCTITTVQGGPFNWQMQHVTAITDASQSLTGNNNPTSGYNFQINTLLRDSILTGAGWISGNRTEGTQTAQFQYDSTSMTVDHMVWPGRTASNYTEYGNNSYFPDSAGCTGAGCHNPVTHYFPATAYATGASCSTANVCFKGSEYKNASSLALAPSDYHDLALDPTSVFRAGGAQQASDGTDMGASIPAIDAAQTLNQYICGTRCGSPGPYPDQ